MENLIETTPDSGNPATDTGEITGLLQRANQGDARAREDFFACVYSELRRLACQKIGPNHDFTQLDPNSLVHEVYLRLVAKPELPFADRRFFLSYAAKIMRSVIVDYVRERGAQKRGGDWVEVTLTNVPAVSEDAEFQNMEFEALHSALQALAKADDRCHQIVEMRYFAGLSVDEIAEVLQLSSKTIKREWQKARVFLRHAMAV